MLFDKRLIILPSEYEWADQYWLDQKNAHWMHTEISMQDDVTDWDKLNEKEKNVIGNILKGFAQTESYVGEYWTEYICNWFPKYEIKAMARAFGSVEDVHAKAYALLNETLHLDDFSAFLDDEATMTKLSTLMEVNKNDNSKENIARSIAIFSAAAEGIQLFSSFAVLFSFRKKGMLTGVTKQMEYSIKDESLHSIAGCKLFRTMCEEYPEIWNDKLKGDIYEGINLAIRNEFHFINKIFELGDLETINKAELKNFMHDRANRKLIELGLKEVYVVDKYLLDNMQWFYTMISGEVQTDFFKSRETGYSEPREDWNNINDLF